MQKRKEEFITNKLLIACTLTIVGVIGSFWLANAVWTSSMGKFFINVLPFVRYAIYGLFALSVLKFGFDVKNKVEFDMKYISSRTITGILSVLCGCQIIEDVFDIYITADIYMASFLVMALVVYYVVLTYGNDILISTICILSAFSMLHIAGKYIDNSLALVVYASIIFGLILSLIFINVAKKNSGDIFKIKVLEENSNYTLLNNNSGTLLAITVVSAIVTVLALFPINVGPIAVLVYIGTLLFASVYKKL